MDGFNIKRLFFNSVGWKLIVLFLQVMTRTKSQILLINISIQNEKLSFKAKELLFS